MPLLVLNVLGPEESAYFYVAWTIATLLFSIPSSLAQSLFAEGSHDKRKLHRDIRRATILSALLLVPAVLFVWLLGGTVLLAFGEATPRALSNCSGDRAGGPPDNPGARLLHSLADTWSHARTHHVASLAYCGAVDRLLPTAPDRWTGGHRMGLLGDARHSSGGDSGIPLRIVAEALAQGWNL